MDTKKSNKIGRIGLFLFVIGLTLFSLYFVSGAGFGSSYLSKIDGELYLEVPIGSDVSYFIYPQNFENEILLVKVNVTDTSNVMKNELEDYYEIPKNTSSDEYKIELVFHLANDTSLIGKKFPFKFEVLSTYKDENSGFVTFNPLGFSKSFYVVGKLPEVITPPVTPPAVTQPVLTGGSSGGGAIKNTTKIKQTNITTKEVTETPKEIATKEQETNQSITNSITEIVKEHKVFGIIAIILIAFVLIGGVIFVIHKMTEDY